MTSKLFNSWDLEAASAVCGSLHCGAAVSTVATRLDFDRGDVWFVKADCVKTAAVKDCVLGGSPGFEGGVKIMCSGTI